MKTNNKTIVLNSKTTDPTRSHDKHYAKIEVEDKKIKKIYILSTRYPWANFYYQPKTRETAYALEIIYHNWPNLYYFAQREAKIPPLKQIKSMQTKARIKELEKQIIQHREIIEWLKKELEHCRFLMEHEYK